MGQYPSVSLVVGLSIRESVVGNAKQLVQQ